MLTKLAASWANVYGRTSNCCDCLMKLATIKLDVDLDTDIQNLTKKEDEKQVLHEIFSKMEFKTWIKELEQEGTYGASPAGGEIDSGNSNLKEAVISIPKGIEYSPILSKGGLNGVIDKLRDLKKFSISVEFNETHFMDAAIPVSYTHLTLPTKA